MHKYNIYFYKDKNGMEPVKEYLKSLEKKNSKDARIKFNKIYDYVKTLSTYGTQIGEPFIKHLEGEIWELRPIRERIFFASFNSDGFILLHHFIKKTQKTPKREIEKAKRELADIKSRG